MLLSKRPEMFLPEGWPTYFEKSEGCLVWDLEGNQYVDMSIMGVGTNILGYSHPKIDEAVRETISKGNMSTLNCARGGVIGRAPGRDAPWADMVKFARSGGEANAIAVESLVLPPGKIMSPYVVTMAGMTGI